MPRAQRPPGACPRASARAPRAPGLADPADGAGADAEATEPQAETALSRERARRPSRRAAQRPLCGRLPPFVRRLRRARQPAGHSGVPAGPPQPGADSWAGSAADGPCDGDGAGSGAPLLRAIPRAWPARRGRTPPDRSALRAEGGSRGRDSGLPAGATCAARCCGLGTLHPRYGFVAGALTRSCVGSYSKFLEPEGFTAERILKGVPSRSEPTINSRSARPKYFPSRSLR